MCTDVAEVEVPVLTMLLLHLPRGRIKPRSKVFKNLTVFICRLMFIGIVILKIDTCGVTVNLKPDTL